MPGPEQTTALPETALDFSIRRLGFVPDEKQKAVLDSAAKRGILNCSRQWGKSSVAALKAVHHAAAGNNRLGVVASPTERQSAEFLRKAEAFVRLAWHGGYGAGVFGGVAAGDRRGVAGER